MWNRSPSYQASVSWVHSSWLQFFGLGPEGYPVRRSTTTKPTGLPLGCVGMGEEQNGEEGLGLSSAYHPQENGIELTGLSQVVAPDFTYEDEGEEILSKVR